MKRMKKRKGMALAMVVIMFFIICTYAASISSNFMNNTRMVMRQKDQLKAYYIMRAGLELGTAAAQQTRYKEVDGVTEPVNLFKEYLDRSDDVIYAYTKVFKYGEDGINGSVQIYSSSKDDGKILLLESIGNYYNKDVDMDHLGGDEPLSTYYGYIRYNTENQAIYESRVSLSKLTDADWTI